MNPHRRESHHQAGWEASALKVACKAGRRLGSILVALTASIAALGGEPERRHEMYRRYLDFQAYIADGSVQPHWISGSDRFWYAEGAPDKTVVYVVDPKANRRQPLFDNRRLRAALRTVLGHEAPHLGVPFEDFTFLRGESAVLFWVEEQAFVLDLKNYALEAVSREFAAAQERIPQRLPGGGFDRRAGVEVLSPDQRWFATVHEDDVWLRSTSDGRRVQLTTDGVERQEWVAGGWPGAHPKWSGDATKLAVMKLDSRNAVRRPLVRWLGETEQVDQIPYVNIRPGDSLPLSEVFIIDVATKRAVRADVGHGSDVYLQIVGWQPRGSTLYLLRMRRDFRRLDLMAVDAADGASRVLLTERDDIALYGSRYFDVSSRIMTLLPGGDRFVWMSERSGWNHLYLYDSSGRLARPLTSGRSPVIEAVAVDPRQQWVYFTSHSDTSRPYDTHLMRTSLRRQRVEQLTTATGQHHIDMAPSTEYFLDTSSTISRPPAVELRKNDGSRVRILAQANVDRLRTELDWKPPEEFTAKAADGRTDLYGTLYKPHDFNPHRKYPAVEILYGGSMFSEVQHGFTHRHFGILDFHGEHAQALAQLGFITFMVDGRGTPERGKAFQDVAFHSHGEHVLADHAAVLHQLAASRPYLDVGRVGVIGHSVGGYFTTCALLDFGGIYKVGVAAASGVELYDAQMLGVGDGRTGLPSIKAEDARRLTGNLLLLHGTSDLNVPFSSLVKLLQILTEAGAVYDLIVLPEQGHFFTGQSRAYAREAIRRYLEDHLRP